MKRLARTKIVATLGPASNSYTELRKMVQAGMDVVRLNFSHGSHAGHLHKINTIREINKKYRRHIRIMQDLEGFRIESTGGPGYDYLYRIAQCELYRYGAEVVLSLKGDY